MEKAEEASEGQENVLKCSENVLKCPEILSCDLEGKSWECKKNYESEYNSDCEKTLIENQKTPHTKKKSPAKRISRQSKNQRFSPSPPRNTPIPILSWADSDEVWKNMIFKEEATLKCRDPALFGERTGYLPRMRAILLDWIMEVCEVYRLRRVTYHLAVDYLDRYLSMNPNVPKTQLQLLGVSCLFIAAKLEEIYPPKLSEFSYVCDGACTDDQILSCEVLLLSRLGWDVNPMTPSEWLNLYMQILYNTKSVVKQKLHRGISTSFQFPQYSAYQFVRASHIVDLFTMDPGYLKFSYSVIAAGSIYYVFSKEVALLVSGLSWDQLEPCVKYMSIFDKIIKSSKDVRLKAVCQQDTDERLLATFRSVRVNVPNLVNDENHSIQSHIIDLECYEKTVILRLDEIGYITPIEDEKELEEPRETETDREQIEPEVEQTEQELERINSELERSNGELEQTDRKINSKISGSNRKFESEIDQVESTIINELAEVFREAENERLNSELRSNEDVDEIAVEDIISYLTSSDIPDKTAT